MNDGWREVQAEWVGESCFVGRNPSGGEIRIGSLGEQPGVSPMELLLMAVAGCTGVDVVNILNKKRQVLTKLSLEVKGRMSAEFPKVYKEIEIIYHMWGSDLEPKAIEHAIGLSLEKYCSVSLNLHGVASIHSRYVIHDED